MLRGGVRQQLKLRDASGKKTKPRRTAIGGFFVRTYLKGGITALAFQQGCQAAGPTASGDLARLCIGAGLHKHRLRKGKLKPDSRLAARAVRRKLLSKVILKNYVTQIPLWDSRANKKVMGNVNILPIHETLDRMVKEGAEMEWASIGDTQAGVQEDILDWGLRQGVDVRIGTWLALALWGDSAPYTKRDSVYLLTHCVLSGIHRKRAWIAVIGKRHVCQCGCWGRCTFDALFEVVAWSFRVLQTGFWPTHDHNGLPLTGWRKVLGDRKTPFRFRGCCTAKCADWAWHKQILAMRGWTGLRRCWGCQALFNDRDFSIHAPWRKTCVTMSGFVSSVLCGDQYASKIFLIPGFLYRYIVPDWMHVVCLGILQYLSGNVMWELFLAVGGTYHNPSAACAALNNMIIVTAKELGVEKPFHMLTVGMIKASGAKKPRMRLKAAEGRHFYQFLL